jgi:hypothetical protein
LDKLEGFRGHKKQNTIFEPPRKIQRKDKDLGFVLKTVNPLCFYFAFTLAVNSSS